MNSQEAFDRLGISPGAEEKDIDSAFRKKAAKLHPDVNKAPDAEKQFKELNEAYQFLKQHKNAPQSFDDLFGMFSINFGNGTFSARQNRPNFRHPSNKIHAKVTISFVESVTGTARDVKYTRKVTCHTCHGDRYIKTEHDEKCDRCFGMGERELDGKKLPCVTCQGTGKKHTRDLCPECNGNAVMEITHELKVSIPPGVTDKNILSLRGQGDSFGNKGYRDAHIEVSVTPDPDMKAMGRHVLSSVKLTLLEAITGTSKTVRTIKGEQTLKIPGPRKHGDHLEAAGMGFPPDGDHIFVLDVQYPDNIQALIDFLSASQTDGYINNDNAKE